ncbi:uncharacterized protein LOC124449820 isoform X2 [Xenia sp. Carnegie-2017]|uniref:uncharacterized protein LOC124449820 isoform X2 n=1 Tax=Xenia sp. Carnegie-2017 TaxID=2897299 RepID=UPI001F03DF04|nr:uncharacterized protein LOC124449820 isoform X2 [Xenia sp. Carnegie-2017]
MEVSSARLYERTSEARKERRNPNIDDWQLQRWAYLGHSVQHGSLLSELCYPGADIKYVGNVRVIFSEKFSLGEGSNETRVFLGLTKDGYGKAVKRIRRDNFLQPALYEKKILNEFNAKNSQYIVKYYFIEEDTGSEYVYLILDLCEESLEKFVKDSNIHYLQKALPDILRQILNGLADLHSGPCPILHRDLKPSNVLRDVDGKFLIVDFGISRILKNGSETHKSICNRGTQYWIAPEAYCETEDSNEARYKKKSDVYNAGMVAYYVATKGKHPFGTKRHRLDNMLNGEPVGLDEIKDETLKDLLSWMLRLQPEERPSANEALKHPFLMSDDEKFYFLCKVGVLQSIKTNDPQSSIVQQLNIESSNWKSQMDNDVYEYLVNGREYGSSWTECLRLIQNIGMHWNDRPRPLPQPEPFYKIGDHKTYFLKTFPNLSVRVHAAFRSNKKLKNDLVLKDKDDDVKENINTYGNEMSAISDKETSVIDNSHIVKDTVEAGQELQLQEWNFFGESTKHRKMFLKLCEYGASAFRKVKHVGDVRVIFSDEFCIGRGNDGTRVFLGLRNDGYGKAVKRIRRDNFIDLTRREKEILNELNAKESKYIVNYSYLEEDNDTEYVYLILDLCEESLESFVKSSTLSDLQKVLPEILRPILQGLAYLHSGPQPILHCNLKPSNVLRDSQGKFLIADFGIKAKANVGTEFWYSPESYCKEEDSFDKARYKTKSDVMNAGMVASYVATKGKHPFGTKRHRLDNMLNGEPVGLDEVKDETLKDLLSWMLKLQPEERPSANEALNHPFLMSDDEKFYFLCKVGDLQSIQQLNIESSNWKSQMDNDVYEYLVNGREYGSSWTECLRLIRNISMHWNDRPRPLLQTEPFYKIGDYKAYFLKTFPSLPVRVHAAVRSNEEFKENPQLKEEWKYIDESTKHRELLLKLIEYGRNPSVEVKEVGNVRVIFSDEFCIGERSGATRVYLGLDKDGYGKAVKRIHRDSCIKLAHYEKKILNELNANESKYVVNYFFLEDTGTEYVYWILDLCEESLESFVKSSCLSDLLKALPDILRQILKGLADLYSGPNPILHRNLKPSNVLRDAKSKFLIADFDISQIKKNDSTTYRSNTFRGTEDWIAPESYCEVDDSVNKARYERRSDVYNAGMVAYYIVTKGKHPFGSKRYRLDNMLNGNPVGWDEIKDETLKDLLSWMLNLKPEDRPSASEALKHPFLMSDNEKFDLLCNVGNLQEIKTSDSQSIVVQRLNSETLDWRSQMDSDVYDYLVNGRTYESSWTECLRLIRNIEQHWNDRPRPPPELLCKIGDYRAYFLRTFPNLPVQVHAAVRSNEELKDNPKLKDCQLERWEYLGHSVQHRSLLSELCYPGRDIKHVGNVRVSFSDKFRLGEGSNETRVYLGLTKDGYGKAVKRIRRDNYHQPAHHERKILNEFNAKNSKYVVNYYFFEEDTGSEYVYLILDLCEESLEKFVKNSTVHDLQTALPDILRQILNGLADLHSGPDPILHRDLKPSNVLRGVDGKFLIADFGISRILKNGSETHKSICNRGAEYWIPPEAYCEAEDSNEARNEDSNEARYKKESDVYNAGIVAYYISTKRNHPFGTKLYRQINMINGNPVGLKEIMDETLKDLLSWMLNLKPEDRPSARRR